MILILQKKNFLCINESYFQAPLSEYQENLFEWYVPYGNFGNVADGEGLGEEDIFQP